MVLLVLRMDLFRTGLCQLTAAFSRVTRSSVQRVGFIVGRLDPSCRFRSKFARHETFIKIPAALFGIAV
jgi:hypothetical protein